MAYNIIITESATKELTKVPVRMQDRIFDKIERLADEPKPAGCKKLRNFDVPGSDHDEYYRIRIGDYRVIYAIEKEQIAIFVIKIAHRKDVYE